MGRKTLFKELIRGFLEVRPTVVTTNYQTKTYLRLVRMRSYGLLSFKSISTHKYKFSNGTGNDRDYLISYNEDAIKEYLKENK